MRNKATGVVVLPIAEFLAGFLPEYIRATRAEGELREARENTIAEMRDLAALAYIQAMAADVSE